MRGLALLSQQDREFLHDNGYLQDDGLLAAVVGGNAVRALGTALKAQWALGPAWR